MPFNYRWMAHEYPTDGVSGNVSALYEAQRPTDVEKLRMSVNFVTAASARLSASVARTLLSRGSVAPDQLPRQWKQKTGVPLGTARTWRFAVAAVTMLVAVSATIAQQHIAATAAASASSAQPLDVATGGEGNVPIVPRQIGGATKADLPAVRELFRGTARPRDVATLALPMSGIVTEVLISVGDDVKARQPLLVVNAEEPKGVLDQLRFEAALARDHVVDLEGAIKALDASIAALTAEASHQPQTESIPKELGAASERAKTVYNEAVAREQRAAALQAHGVAAREELEQAQLEVRTASEGLALLRREAEAVAKFAAAQALQRRTQIDLAIAEQQRQHQERAGELVQTRLRQRQAETALERTRAQYGDFTLRAPGNGLVAQVAVHPGERAVAGAPLVKLATVDPMIVDVDVPSALVDKITRGNPVVIRISESGQEYAGRVRAIAPLPGKAGAHPVEVEFANPNATVLAGRAADVRFSFEH
jgi:multidrug resistance efflux pump